MFNRSTLILFLYVICAMNHLEAFDKVIIWGHKLHSHTHSYIHQSFYQTFKFLGYPTYWFDDTQDVEDFDFSNSLFLTEGQADKRIPLRLDCFYMVHNCSSNKYEKTLPLQNWICFQVYTDQILDLPKLVKLEPCIYYDLPARCLYMPWATDLLPDQIDAIKKAMPFVNQQKTVFWIGTMGEGVFGNIEQINPFKKACQENGINFAHMSNLDPLKATALIQNSYMAPAIVGAWQEKKGYIPCRIFKNISYGQMGITNSYRVSELFDHQIVYNSDTYQLFYDAQKRLETLTLDELFALMDLVKERHTYINRVQTLLQFLDLVHQTFSPTESLSRNK